MNSKLQHAQNMADGAAVTSVASAATAWSIAHVNEVAQLVATTIAILSGLAALWWHVKKIRALSRAQRNVDPEVLEDAIKDLSDDSTP